MTALRLHIFVISLFLPGLTQAEPTEDLRLLTYNIHMWQPGVKALSAVIKESNADIVALNESWNGKNNDAPTILANGPGTSAGQTEEISSFVTSENGTPYIVVDEGNAGLDTCQLSRLEVVVTLPQVTLALTSTSLVEESFLGQNGNPDPGETARYDLTLKSVGNLAASNTQATLTGPPRTVSSSPSKASATKPLP